MKSASNTLRASVFLTAMLALGARAMAQPEDTSWLADQRGCKVANPYPQPNETITWSGECEDGYAHGQGVLIFFIDGKPHSRYEGALEKGWAVGKGTLHFPDGSVYSGEWRQSAENGVGRREWTDGSFYDGGWKNGKPHGQGQFRRPDGKTFTGEWVDGVFEGDMEPDDDPLDDPNRT
jgi:hypothetical protein